MAVIYGDAKPGEPDDSLVGTVGPDEIYGLTGNDTLAGAEGEDSLHGGEGDDLLYGDGEDALFSGGAGTDTLYLDGFYYFENLALGADASIETLELGGTVFGSSQNNRFDLSGVSDFTRPPPSDLYIVEILLGEGDDTFIGGAGDDEASGDGGDDVLEGGAGSDRLFGGSGADLISGGSDDDALIGGGGADTLDGGDGDDAFYVDAGDVGSLSIVGGSGYDGLALGYASIYKDDDRGETIVLDDIDLSGASIEYMFVTYSLVRFDYTIYGTSEANVFDLSDLEHVADPVDLGAGDDVYRGSRGDDSAIGGADDDLLSGGDGFDSLFGGAGLDTLDGSGGDDAIRGEAGADVLKGGSGADRLFGGAGRDRLLGGDDRDAFVFDAPLRSKQADVILDFSVKDDTIALDLDVFAGLDLGVVEKDAFVKGSAAKDAQDRIVYDAKSGSLWFDADGSGRDKAVLFATVDDGLRLSRRDFEVMDFS